jgi:hypothetical protein
MPWSSLTRLQPRAPVEGARLHARCIVVAVLPHQFWTVRADERGRCRRRAPARASVLRIGVVPGLLIAATPRGIVESRRDVPRRPSLILPVPNAIIFRLPETICKLAITTSGNSAALAAPYRHARLSAMKLARRSEQSGSVQG